MAGQENRVGRSKDAPWGGLAKIAIAGLLALSLSACGTIKKDTSNEQNVGPCPLMGVLYDSARMVELDGAESMANVGYTAEMRSVTGLCRYVGADPIVMNLDVAMAFGRGPKAVGDTHTYRYWVTVARRDVLPLAKQYFDVTVKFPNGADRTETVERIERITIPRATPTTSGVNFEILVGFELTPEQLAFNRAGKRFRVTAGR